MLPTLQEKEIVRIASHQEPARFDIVVLHPPDDAEENYVKRVIGLPGERLRYHDGELFVDEKLVKDSFAHLTADFTLQQLGVDQIPEGYYFVLGDNREVSQDSRYFGLVPASKIVGIIRG